MLTSTTTVTLGASTLRCDDRDDSECRRRTAVDNVGGALILASHESLRILDQNGTVRTMLPSRQEGKAISPSWPMQASKKPG